MSMVLWRGSLEVEERVHPYDLLVLMLLSAGVVLTSLALHPGLAPYVDGLAGPCLRLGLSLTALGLASSLVVEFASSTRDYWLRRVYYVKGDLLIVKRCLFKWPLRRGRSVNPHELFVGGSGAGKSNAEG